MIKDDHKKSGEDDDNTDTDRVHNTDLEATQVTKWMKIVLKIQFYHFQSKSLECGVATGCLKIVKKAYESGHVGKFISKEGVWC